MAWDCHKQEIPPITERRQIIIYLPDSPRWHDSCASGNKKGYNTFKRALGSCALVLIFKLKTTLLAVIRMSLPTYGSSVVGPKEHAALGVCCPAQLGPKGTLPSTAEFTVRLTTGAIR